MIAFILSVLATAQRDVRCPTTYELVGKRCVKTVTVEPTQACVDGVNRGGVCTSTAKPQLKCGGGYRQEGNFCVKMSTLDKVKKIAPVGYTDNGKEYVRSIPLEKELYCNTGELVGDKCVIEREVPASDKRYCPDGTSPDQKGCQVRVSLETTSVCESGHLADGQCLTYEELAPVFGIPECPTDTVLNGDKCVREVPAAPIWACPNGDEPINNMCTKEKMLKMIPKPMCPPGYEKDGNACSREVAGMISKACPLGTEDHGDECIKTETAKAIESSKCPEGYEEQNSKDLCYRTEVYDCTPAAPSKDGLRGGETQVRTITQECERKETAQKEVTTECPEGFEVSIDGACVKYIPVPKQEACSVPGGSVDDCVGQETTDIIPEISCPEPFKLINNVCTSTEIIAPKQICESTGLEYSESCVVAEEFALAPVKSCAPGYKMQQAGEICQKLIKTAPKQVCEDQRLPANDCVMRSYVAPVETSSCPSGAIQKIGGQGCVIKTVLNAQLMCEDGNHEDICEKVDTLPYQYQCPALSTAEGKSGCVIREKVGMEQDCEDGALVNGMCLITYPSSTVCPKGYRLLGDKCFSKEFAKPIVTYTASCVGKNCDA